VLGGGAEAGWQVEEVLRRLQERGVGLATDVRVELHEEAGMRALQSVGTLPASYGVYRPFARGVEKAGAWMPRRRMLDGGPHSGSVLHRLSLVGQERGGVWQVGWNAESWRSRRVSTSLWVGAL
jgi:hypothetical protein